MRYTGVMQHWRSLIPYFPLSVITFFGVLVALTELGVIASPATIVEYLSSWYETYGLWGLFVSSLLEAIAYIGLYFPGSVVILLLFLASGGSFVAIASIASVVGIATGFGCVLSYALGRARVALPHWLTRRLTTDTPVRTAPLIYVLLHWHPNAIALWFFKAGFERRSVYVQSLLTPLIMGSWSFVFWSSVQLFMVEPTATVDETTLIVSVLILWLVLDVAIKYYRNYVRTNI